MEPVPVDDSFQALFRKAYAVFVIPLTIILYFYMTKQSLFLKINIRIMEGEWLKLQLVLNVRANQRDALVKRVNDIYSSGDQNDDLDFLKKEISALGPLFTEAFQVIDRAAAAGRGEEEKKGVKKIIYYLISTLEEYRKKVENFEEDMKAKAVKKYSDLLDYLNRLEEQRKSLLTRLENIDPKPNQIEGITLVTFRLIGLNGMLDQTRRTIRKEIAAAEDESNLGTIKSLIAEHVRSIDSLAKIISKLETNQVKVLSVEALKAAGIQVPDHDTFSIVEEEEGSIEEEISKIQKRE